MVLTKAHAVQVIRRVYGPEVAKSLADKLPESIDLESTTDVEMLARLGIVRERLFNALGSSP